MNFKVGALLLSIGVFGSAQCCGLPILPGDEVSTNKVSSDFDKFQSRFFNLTTRTQYVKDLADKIQTEFSIQSMGSTDHPTQEQAPQLVGLWLKVATPCFGDRAFTGPMGSQADILEAWRMFRNHVTEIAQSNERGFESALAILSQSIND